MDIFSEEKITNEINKIKNLIQNKNFTDEELREKAVASLTKKEFDITQYFNDPEEKKEAQKIFTKYIEEYPDLSYSQLDQLKDLVIYSVQKNYNLGLVDKAKEKKQPIQKVLFEQQMLLDEHILKIKDNLGIGKLESEKTVNDLTALETLQKRFEDYVNDNKDEFTTKCRKCGTMLLLRRRTKDFECLKHPFFVGTWLANLPLLQYVKDGILTRQQGANILHGAHNHTHVKDHDYCLDYIDYIIDHWAEFFGDYEKDE